MYSEEEEDMATKKLNRSKKTTSRKTKVRGVKKNRISRNTRKQSLRKKMRGGNTIFPATFSNSDVDVSPQSYLPYNKFENDPGYSTVAARNTGPFLTGGRRMKKGKWMRGGAGDDLSSGISNSVNSVTNNVGIIPVPAINELSGVAGVMSGFSNTGTAYNSTPIRISPLA
jgi:hypothetical protein